MKKQKIVFDDIDNNVPSQKNDKVLYKHKVEGNGCITIQDEKIVKILSEYSKRLKQNSKNLLTEKKKNEQLKLKIEELKKELKKNESNKNVNNKENDVQNEINKNVNPTNKFIYNNSYKEKILQNELICIKTKYSGLVKQCEEFESFFNKLREEMNNPGNDGSCTKSGCILM